MPILSTREDYAARIQQLVGDRNDDDTLSIIQDLTETYDSFSGNTGISQADVDAAVAQRDNEWRERYKKAFFSGTPEPLDGDNKSNPSDPDPDDPSNYDELFKS